MVRKWWTAKATYTGYVTTVISVTAKRNDVCDTSSTHTFCRIARQTATDEHMRTQLQSDTEYVEVSITKTKIGPLTARYVAGEGYVDVDPRQTSDKPTRKGLVGLDNSHSSDYKIAYASDPVVVIHGDGCRSHDELRRLCDHHELLPQNVSPIRLPHGSKNWTSAFQSLPRDASRLDRYADKLRAATDREMDYRRKDTAANGFIPKP